MSVIVHPWSQYTPKDLICQENSSRQKIDPKWENRFPAHSKTVVIMLKDMVSELESERKTLRPF